MSSPAPSTYTPRTYEVKKPFFEEYWWIGFIIMIVGFFLIAAVLAIAICCHFERSAQSKRRKEIKSMRERNHSDSEDDETSIEMETAPMQPSGRGSEGSSRGRRRA